MTPWDVARMRRAIERKFGKPQADLAHPCLRSLWDRQFYAWFHYQRAEQTLKRYVRTHLSTKEFVTIAVGADREEWHRFNLVIRKIGADVTACVQSLHALPDILASAVYYSLALNTRFAPKPGRYVNHEFVCDQLKAHPDVGSVVVPLSAATTGVAFKHVAALANQSKHYSIIFPALDADLTGKRAEQYMLSFPGFITKRKRYPQALVSDLLPPVHEQLSRSIVEAGHTITALLQPGAA